MIVADRHDEAVRSVRRPTGRSRRTSSSTSVKPRSRSPAAIPSRWRSRSGPATRSRTRRGRPIVSPTARSRRAAPFRRGGRVPGTDRAVNQPFRFTVAAGDDSTSIRDVAVRVVPPPALKSLAVRLVAPAYTGLPSQVLAPGLTQFRALEGTRLELEAWPTSRWPAPSCAGETIRPAASWLSTRRGTRFKTALTVKRKLHLLVRLEGHRGLPEPRGRALRRARLPRRGPPRRDRGAEDRPRRPGRRDDPGPRRSSTTISASTRRG